jgi:hypothetical protein
MEHVKPESVVHVEESPEEDQDLHMAVNALVRARQHRTLSNVLCLKESANIFVQEAVIVFIFYVDKETSVDVELQQLSSIFRSFVSSIQI